MKKDRDELDDLFRSKLYDYEADTFPEDWEAIEKRLPRPSVSMPRRTWYYGAVAAVAALLVAISGIYFNKEEIKTEQLAEQTRLITQPIPAISETNPESGQKVLAQATPKFQAVKADWWTLTEEEKPELQEAEMASEPEEPLKETDYPRTTVLNAQPNRQSRTLRTEQSSQNKELPEAKKPKRKWSFGMGAGSISAGNSNSIGSYALRSSSLMPNETLALMNAVNMFQAPETEIHHKMPFSIGVSASRQFTDRWSLQLGLSYALLSSDWKTNTDYWGECKQRLHFLGIPVSVSYKIAEWKRFQFYASAGGKAELNVAGKLRTELYSQEEVIGSYSEKQRVKEPYFSINGRVGVSYPLVRFLSAYAEVGADYYFDNGSDIETYYTEKPFRFGLQVGFRFGL